MGTCTRVWAIFCFYPKMGKISSFLHEPIKIKFSATMKNLSVIYDQPTCLVLENIQFIWADIKTLANI